MSGRLYLGIFWVSLDITCPYDTSQYDPHRASEREPARGVFMVTWTTPAYTEINMSAEIGGYQDDFDERGSKPEEVVRAGDDSQSVPNVA